MTTYETQQVASWVGRTAEDVNGDKIGTVDAVYEDDDGSGPEWFAISTGWFGNRVSFVPVRGATTEGDRLRLPWDKDIVKDAPHAEADGHLSPEEEARLYQYYGMEWETGTTTAQTNTATMPRTTETTATTGMTGTADDAMTRSEEEVDVSKTSRETGRVRLRKWVETEQVNVTVPVRKEVARLVSEPITGENVDKAMSGPEITESEHEVVLSEEQVVVDKQVVPKERVRLEKDVVEEERQVSEEVRKERIAVDDDGTTNTTTSQR